MKVLKDSLLQLTGLFITTLARATQTASGRMPDTEFWRIVFACYSNQKKEQILKVMLELPEVKLVVLKMMDYALNMIGRNFNVLIGTW